MNDDLKKLEEEAMSSIEQADTEHNLNELKALYLGKKSKLQNIMAQMKDLSIEAKKELGRKSNEFKTKVENLIEERRKKLADALINEKLKKETIDVTLPGKKIHTGYLHPLHKVVEEIEDVFIGMGYEIAEGPEVEEDLYNFEMLNLPKGHPAREMQDSFYINDTILLRTHTSPVQAHTLLEKEGQPFKIICPGKVYRRDNDDATHSHQFMQCEGLVVGENVTMADLKGTLTTIASKVFGDKLAVRFRPSFFPFTEPSVEVDVQCFKCGGKGCSLCKGSGWIEVLGAGMVHPNVLKMAGYDTNKYQGFAFGVGVERIAMLRYGIDDIRNFYTNDIRFLKQF
ncbi:MAG: phenylalanine--tRNA ligase subunit alpha [Acholeplasmataceae bacterium]|nr:phenylalanine--tRNA ligase subunit alpha [Acholeplasmataceae bacterium]